MVPTSVARGMVLSGFLTSSAGTVADSTPRNAHRVSAATAVTAANGDIPLVLKGTKWLQFTQNRPMVAIATRGTSFMIVVITWNIPACLMPMTLIQVTSQISPMATSPDN